ncbi:MAG: hypothetical protein ACJ72B_14380 [Ornithinibacter sp.]
MPSTRTAQPITDDRAPVAAAAVPRDNRLLAAVIALTAVSLAGSLLSVVSGLSADWWQAVGPTGRLSVPLPMNAALIVLALAAASRRRRLALTAATVLALACSAAVVSGLFDGGYAAALTPVQRLTQVALVLGLTVVTVLAVLRARQTLQRARLADSAV